MTGKEGAAVKRKEIHTVTSHGCRTGHQLGHHELWMITGGRAEALKLWDSQIQPKGHQSGTGRAGCSAHSRQHRLLHTIHPSRDPESRFKNPPAAPSPIALYNNSAGTHGSHAGIRTGETAILFAPTREAKGEPGFDSALLSLGDPCALRGAAGDTSQRCHQPPRQTLLLPDSLCYNLGLFFHRQGPAQSHPAPGPLRDR